ncbi:hypothetical protein SAMN05428936_101325 [Pelagibacterium halotolerans]|uniref:Secreted protein n=1 Tax=Pelagibacterium halotolerans (strain DSM 22347 / JCM 15775 / CGMCC 1.7692 / B2) TaxID=1082931 RepID=G4R9L6_PELHB|nr:hypothetical protein KKY_392 [Pelagibacterium halotolerans B2]SDZ87043.1 hypothetical protein SAMN05428936_101325 [Pelagibacterium halotolerans]
MTRYLPILMLAFGLLLVSASFASARAPETLPADVDSFCLEASAKVAFGSEAPEKLGRCWKQMGLGILVPGCQVHAHLARVEQPPKPDTQACWPTPRDIVVDDGPPPLLDIPPPRA